MSEDVAQTTSQRVGLDIGTYHICSAQVNADKLEVKKEINAFFTIPITNGFMLGMLKNSGAPVIEVGGNAYVFGENAKDLALSMGKEYQRPMKNGILSVDEKEAFNILAVIIRSMLGEIREDGAVVYYSVPADAINSETNADYHRRVLQAILDKHKVDGKGVRAFPINEALAIVFAELTESNRTGIGISFGAGMVNICYAMFSVPMVQFSLTNSGDWIDREAAKSCGETISFVNEAKKDVDLMAEPQSSVERALVYHYQIMVEKAIHGIADGIRNAGTKAKPGKPVDIVLAGGSASPKNFTEFFKAKLAESNFPIKTGDIRLAKQHLYTVAKGCLVAAQSHSEK